jgi:hypothetical protein
MQVLTDLENISTVPIGIRRLVNRGLENPGIWNSNRT